MGLLDPPAAAQPRDLKEAAQQMESLMLRQILTASGAFRGSEVAGGSIRSDLFVETLANAVAKAGGIGLAAQLEKALAPPAAPATGAPPALASLVHPLEGDARLTSGFGVRSDPLNGHAATHRGVDLAAPQGSGISAAMSGVVRKADEESGYGKMVEIDHGNGVKTRYAHASELLVREGQKVEQGQEIAKVGETGRATGPHLHFEMWVGGRQVDPARALKVYRQRADILSERLP